MAIAGLLYSWYLLTPILLDYLATDAQAAGLSTEWRLSSFVGFIVNLGLACAIGFQAPLITLLSLQGGAITRNELLEFRRHIWFCTFVLGALFSPPDIFSQVMLAVPLLLFYEAAIFLLILDHTYGTPN